MSRKPNKETPIAQGKHLTYPTPLGKTKETIESDAWYQWLESDDNNKFYVEAMPHNYTARCERKRNKKYWYAYMKKNERLHKVYMGASDKLTHEFIFRTIPIALDEKYLASP